MSIVNLNDRPASADIPYDFISTFHQQKAAFENNKFPSLNERRRQLKALKEALTDNSDEIIAALSKDFGSRCTEETRLSEISNSVGNIEYASRHLASWMRTRSRGTGIWFLPGENKIAPQPRGGSRHYCSVELPYKHCCFWLSICYRCGQSLHSENV